MQKLELATLSFDDCTLGRLRVGDFTCFTLELPWKDNSRKVSCIPEGTYLCQAGVSPSNGNVIKVYDVPNRSHIQIHAGNFTSDIEGCTLVGDGIKKINKDAIPDVSNSSKTLSRLLQAVGKDKFWLMVNREYSRTQFL